MLKSKASKRLNSLLATPQGEELLTLLQEEYGGLSYTKGDPVDTAFREGQRSVVLYLEEVRDERPE